MSEEFKQKLNDYEAILGEMFPLMQVMGMTYEAIIERIDECIYERKLYDELFPIDIDDLY